MEIDLDKLYHPKQKPVIWVEGIIGCGKTTLTKTISRDFNFRAIYEPVNLELLELFYKDQERWAFAMQIDLLHRRFALQKLGSFESVTGQGVVIDRGLPGDRVFAKMLHNAGKIHPIEWAIYEKAFTIMSNSLIPPSLIIFMDVSPEVALERIRMRDRKAERGELLPLTYLEELQRGYFELLDEIKSGKTPWSRGMRVIQIPWNDPEESAVSYAKVSEIIRNSQ
ncbi:MAG: deoxynucleoside kinase [Candidatus Heimdallarchaeota archaeon]|nr:MAG: deoxynucleoside kinase [Candidatus Heimdallarchaeota archaeon]